MKDFCFDLCNLKIDEELLKKYEHFYYLLRDNEMDRHFLNCLGEKFLQFFGKRDEITNNREIQAFALAVLERLGVTIKLEDNG